MKSIFKKAMPLLSIALIVASCDKNDSPDNGDTAQLKTDILINAADGVIVPGYNDMYAKATALSDAVTALVSSSTDENLAKAQDAWKAMRVTWEQSEAWLFGPVEADDIDPRIDTWPVDFNALDAQLASSNEFTESYIDNLPEDLKGFHPIEYLLWGKEGNKTAANFKPREKQYLSALTNNLKKLSESVKNSWTSGYNNTFKSAGAAGNTEYATQLSAFEDLVNGMAGICDEVANSKMHDPFQSGDASQEESPFAKNSITDFTNNITGILKMYQGQFTSDGKGIEDLVRSYNLSLDQEIKTKHATAIAALKAITDPFGKAIKSQPQLVQAAMDKINDLASTLNDKLLPFVQQYAK